MDKYSLRWGKRRHLRRVLRRKDGVKVPRGVKVVRKDWDDRGVKKMGEKGKEVKQKL